MENGPSDSRILAVNPKKVESSGPAAGENRLKNRVLGLDILRFIAVTLVVFRHMRSFQGSPQWLNRISRHLSQGGWVGVDIFFVLSGFLVSGLLFREWQQHKTLSVGRFLWRRGWKIYPPFWFFLLGMITFLLCRHQTIDWRGMLGEFLFVQNYWANAFNHTWSLAVEEHFYLMVAIGSWLLFRWQRHSGANPYRFLPWIFLFVACLCLGVRIITNAMFIMGRVRLTFFCTHIRIDSLLFGVLLSYFWHFTFTARHHEFFHRWRFALLAAGAALLAPMFFAEPMGPNEAWIRDFGFILCYVAGGLWVVAFMNIFDGNRSKPAHCLGFLGANSYSVYLWHELAIILVTPLFVGHLTSAFNWMAFCLLTHAAAWTIGLTAARVVEIPMLVLRDRWFPSKTTKPLDV